MAIRIINIRVDGKKVFNEHQLAVAKQIEEFLEEAGIIGDVTISRYFSDRWYKLDRYQELLEEGK